MRPAVAVMSVAFILQPQVAALPHDPPAAAMRRSARELILALPMVDRNALEHSFDDEGRLAWNYTPVERSGMALGGLQDTDRERVWKFVGTGLGERGLRQAREIIQLEELLYASSGGNARRDPDAYWLNFYGTPATIGRWGWRFEGHHLSVSFTILDDRVVGSTPAFFGGNPALVKSGKYLDLRPFAIEEDAARALLDSLDAAQRTTAIVSASPHPDVLTMNQHYVRPLTTNGVRYADLSSAQQEALLGLLQQYAARLEPSLADRELAEIRAAGLQELRFAWAGGTERRQPHYYRIQGPTFVVEYDNTQDNANHVHTVWRSFARDFGRNPLREHLAGEHGRPAPGAAHAHPHAAAHAYGDQP